MNTMKTLIIYVLVTAASYAGVSLLYDSMKAHLLALVTVKESISTPEIVEQAKQEIIKKDRRHPGYAIIVSRNIFQSASGPGNKQVEAYSDEDLEESSLRLSLQGTIVSGSDQDDRAVILDEKTKKQNLYRVGDSLQGCSIKKIQRGKVIILNGEGKLEVLLLKEREGGGPGLSERKESSRLPRVKRNTSAAVAREPKKPVRLKRRISVRETDADRAEIIEPDEPLEEDPPIKDSSDPSDDSIDGGGAKNESPEEFEFPEDIEGE